ncbi:MAG: hypothetical protein QOE76_2061, partial [Frankiales bacterium]|nr:hypothetical protein [Frankiales bacterium]
ARNVGGLQHVRARLAGQRLGPVEVAEATSDQQLVPLRPVLVEQQHRFARGADPGRGAGGLDLHQRHQAVHLWLVRRESGEHPAESLASRPGRYVLQAAIVACHARARTADETDWIRIAALYEALAAIEPSPVVELNRAVAVGMAHGPAAGLELVDALTSEGSLARYHLLPSVRGDLLSRLGRLDEARRSFELAASITQNDSERTLLLNRAASCS